MLATWNDLLTELDDRIPLIDRTSGGNYGVSNSGCTLRPRGFSFKFLQFIHEGRQTYNIRNTEISLKTD